MPGLSLSGFADKVGELMPVIMREYVRHQGEKFNKLKITMPQFIVLDIIGRRGEYKMSDVAKFLGVTTAATTGIVDRLVREGYLVRKSDPDDRRIIRVKLTSKGAKIVKEMVQIRREITIKIFGMISAAERQEYLKILTHVKDHLAESE